MAEGESDQLRVKAAELAAAAEFRERLLGIIGHDLRNPLQTIVVAAELLQAGGKLPEKDLWIVRRIADSGQRMGRMIDQLANFTRARLGGGFNLELTLCDMGVICRDVVEELRLSSGAEILFIATGRSEGRWDGDRISEVLSNLIGNATNHATPGTPVRVYARDEGSDVVVDVRNEGTDIAPERLESIFSAFGRPQSERQRENGHLGLGLYISREILVAHQGVLDVQSAAGKTTFSFRLPRLARG